MPYAHPYVLCLKGDGYGKGYVWGDGEGEFDNKKRSFRRGFNLGDTVTVAVNMETGLVTWIVNGKELTNYTMNSVKNRSIKWVPYLDFGSTGDKVEIIE